MATTIVSFRSTSEQDTSRRATIEQLAGGQAHV
jgi:hypothetical protein